jgi:hypothetical protein
VSDKNLPIVVIGSGLAGLSAALTLQESGYPVRVLECGVRAGGRIQSDEINGFRLDRGFQFINAKYPQIKALGIVDDLDFQPAPRAVDVAFNGKVIRLGDPRKYLFSVFNNATGSLPEKISFLRYLISRSQAGSSVESEILNAGCGELYLRVLKPFLTGVFLAPPSAVDGAAGRAIIKSFIQGSPGLPADGAGALTRILAQRVGVIELDVQVNSIDGLTLETSQGVIHTRAIIVATDQTSAAQLLGLEELGSSAGCTTWYHATRDDLDVDATLRVDGLNRGLVINSICISALIEKSAPPGYTLFSSTSLGTVSESDVRRHLAMIWGCDTAQWELIAKYEIRNALPLFTPGWQKQASTCIRPYVYRAGDYLRAPSQDGALASGRGAAIELINALRVQQEPK